MEPTFSHLPTGKLPAHSRFILASYPSDIVQLTSPALSVFLDFKRKSPYSIEKSKLVHEALHNMKLLKVKSLFVVDEHNDILGHISTRDIQGIKAAMTAQAHGIKMPEVTVGMLMVPYQELNTLHYDELKTASVGHIVRLFHDLNTNYIFVLAEEEGENMVRGMFSISRLSKQLGQHLSINLHSTSLADINKKLL